MLFLRIPIMKFRFIFQTTFISKMSRNSRTAFTNQMHCILIRFCLPHLLISIVCIKRISCHFVIRFVLIFWVTKSKKMSLACGKLVTIRRSYSEWCFNFWEFTVSQECVLKATKWRTFLYTISPWIVFFSAIYHVDISPLNCVCVCDSQYPSIRSERPQFYPS